MRKSAAPRLLTTVALAVFAAGWGGYLYAQQAGSSNVVLPQPYFRAPENTWATGEKPDEITAGVVPDYRVLLDDLTVVPVQGTVWLVGGAGANIAMQVTDEGVLLVDAGDERAADKLIAVVQRPGRRPLRWIINTSLDLDHTGGNGKVAKIGRAGLITLRVFPGDGVIDGAPQAGIFAFETVLTRMSGSSGQTEARAADAWPTDTFTIASRSFSYGHEAIEMLHQPAAHTDGDVMVFFRKSDVIAAGDIFASDRYPIIDMQNGGTLRGVIDGLNTLVRLAVPEYNQQGGTRVIPGHGRIGNQSDVVEYRDMVTIVRDRIATLAGRGMPLVQILAARPTLDYDGLYGTSRGSADAFIEAVYRQVTTSARSTSDVAR